MHGVRTAHRPDRSLRKAEAAHLSRVDQLAHRSDGLLDRDVRIDAVLVVEVDAVRREPAQGCFAAGPHVLRPAVDAARGRILRIADDAELGRYLHLVAAPGDRAADQLLVLERAVDVRRVEQRHPELDGAVDRGDRFRLVGVPVELRHAHATESLDRDLETLAAEWHASHRARWYSGANAPLAAQRRGRTGRKRWKAGFCVSTRPQGWMSLQPGFEMHGDCG